MAIVATTVRLSGSSRLLSGIRYRWSVHCRGLIRVYSSMRLGWGQTASGDWLAEEIGNVPAFASGVCRHGGTFLRQDVLQRPCISTAL